MTTKSQTDNTELDEIQLALIMEVTSMIATACNSYHHFHGQEEGEDPAMDKYWKQEEEALKAFWDKIAKLLKQQDIKSRIDEQLWHIKTLEDMSANLAIQEFRAHHAKLEKGSE